MLWKANMSPEEEAVDWLVGTVVRERRRYRVPSLQQAKVLETLNQHLLDTCLRRHLTCVDLEKTVPR